MSKQNNRSFLLYSGGDRIFIAVDTLLLTGFLIVILYPLLYVVASSFSGGSVLKGLSLIPEHFSLEGYRAVYENPYVWSGYRNSVIYTLLGTAIAMLATILAAYPLSRSDFRFGHICMALCVFTMYFGGGLIPTYVWIRKLGLLNTMWAVLLPGAVHVYNTIVMRTYFKTSIPKELRESAQIDGCGEWRYLIQIVLPLSGAVLAVVSLYFAVDRWNSYFSEMIYLQDRTMHPLQNILRDLLIVNQANAASSVSSASEAAAQERADLLRYSMIVVASLPMMLAYPFVQKYFVKGVMLGSVKG